jgi:hypothetical protein
MKITGLLISVHSPVVALQSSLSTGISRVSSICFVNAITSSRVATTIEGFGSGFTVFGLLSCIWPPAVITANKTANVDLKTRVTMRLDIYSILSNHLKLKISARRSLFKKSTESEERPVTVVLALRRIARINAGELRFNFRSSRRSTHQNMIGRKVRAATLCLALTSLTLFDPSVLARPIKPGPSAPRAITDATAFNFGDVYRGEIISQIFIIRNEGDAELKLTDFKSGCGCEVTSWDKSIPAGKQGNAMLEVQTVSQSGEIEKIATLYTNDPDRPTIVFTLRANVLHGAPSRQGRYIGPVFLSPDSHGALYANPGTKASTEFLITADNKPVKVLRVEGATQHFASRIEPVEPGRSYKLIVESLPTSKPDLYIDRLRVITDSESLPAFMIDLALRVYPNQ